MQGLAGKDRAKEVMACQCEAIHMPLFGRYIGFVVILAGHLPVYAVGELLRRFERSLFPFMCLFFKAIPCGLLAGDFDGLSAILSSIWPNISFIVAIGVVISALPF
jgi:hypothetical protein